jgi:DNA-binding response OmpR family regulator
MTITCPNCGFHHTGSTYAPEIDGVKLPRAEYDIILRLRQAAGAIVTNDNLVDFVYGDRLDGGPENAAQCIQTYVSKANRKIRPLGWSVVAERFRGYRLVREST